MKQYVGYVNDVYITSLRFKLKQDPWTIRCWSPVTQICSSGNVRRLIDSPPPLQSQCSPPRGRDLFSEYSELELAAHKAWIQPLSQGALFTEQKKEKMLNCSKPKLLALHSHIYMSVCSLCTEALFSLLVVFVYLQAHINFKCSACMFFFVLRMRLQCSRLMMCMCEQRRQHDHGCVFSISMAPRAPTTVAEPLWAF